MPRLAEKHGGFGKKCRGISEIRGKKTGNRRRIHIKFRCLTKSIQDYRHTYARHVRYVLCFLIVV